MMTTLLIIFAMLVANSDPAAKWHAMAARRLGATWEELQAVVNLAVAIRAFAPLNQGGALLAEIRAAESAASTPKP